MLVFGRSFWRELSCLAGSSGTRGGCGPEPSWPVWAPGVMPKRIRGPGFWGTPFASISPVQELCCAPAPGAVAAVATAIAAVISTAARFSKGRRMVTPGRVGAGRSAGLCCTLRTARSRIWPTATPVRRAWERRDAGRVRSRGDSTLTSAQGKPRRLRRGKRCVPLLGGPLGRDLGDARADLLVDELDQLGAEAEGALEGFSFHVVGRVGGLMVVRRGRAGDGGRGEASRAGCVRVRRAPQLRRFDQVARVVPVLLLELAAERVQLAVLLQRDQRTLPCRVANGARADLVDVQHECGPGVEAVAVLLQPGPRAGRAGLLRTREQDPQVEMLERAAVALCQPQHRGDSGGVVVRARYRAAQGDVGEVRDRDDQERGRHELDDLQDRVVEAGKSGDRRDEDEEDRAREDRAGGAVLHALEGGAATTGVVVRGEDE